MSLKCMQVMDGADVVNHDPLNDKTWEPIANVNGDSLTFKLCLTKCEPSECIASFDCVTALAENKILCAVLNESLTSFVMLKQHFVLLILSCMNFLHCHLLAVTLVTENMKLNPKQRLLWKF